MKQEYKYPTWAWVIFWVLTIFLSLNPFITLIQMAVFFWFKPYFTAWALKINKSPVVPFLLVFFFGLFGYLGYYIYYRIKVKGVKNGK